MLALDRAEQQRLLVREVLAREHLEPLAIDVCACSVGRGAAHGRETAREHVVVRDERAHERIVLRGQRGEEHLALDAIDQLDEREDVALQLFAALRRLERGLALLPEQVEQDLVFVTQQHGCAAVLARLSRPFGR
jgi:hypothetical protein